MNKMLFRGKRADNGEWVQSCCILRLGVPFCMDDDFFIAETKDKMEIYMDENGNITEIPECKFYLVDPKTVGRSTGLHDRNGKLLFEGDIVKIRGVPFPAHITWYEYDGLYTLTNALRGFTDDFTRICDDQCEWIGNIHENAELLGSDAE